MVICPDCGKDVKDAKFCSNCGSRLPEADEVVSQEIEEKVDVPVEEEAIEEAVEDSSEEEVVDDEVAEEAVEVPAERETAEEVAEDAADVPAEEERAEEVSDEEAVEDVQVEEEVVDAPAEEETAEEDEIEVNKKTKFCSNCGTEVSPEVAFCPQCGFNMKREEEPQTKFCQNCGKKIDINAEICPHCGVRVANPRYSEERNVALSAILSIIFPGLGHLYLGLSKKGLSFILAYIVSAILIFLLIGFVLMLIVWVWALIDSIKSTEAINRGEFVEDKLF